MVRKKKTIYDKDITFKEYEDLRSKRQGRPSKKTKVKPRSSRHDELPAYPRHSEYYNDGKPYPSREKLNLIGKKLGLVEIQDTIYESLLGAFNSFVDGHARFLVGPLRSEVKDKIENLNLLASNPKKRKQDKITALCKALDDLSKNRTLAQYVFYSLDSRYGLKMSRIELMKNLDKTGVIERLAEASEKFLKAYVPVCGGTFEPYFNDFLMHLGLAYERWAELSSKTSVRDDHQGRSKFVFGCFALFKNQLFHSHRSTEERLRELFKDSETRLNYWKH